MTYVERTLNAGEGLVETSRLHRIVFLPAVLVAALAAVLLGAGGESTAAQVGGRAMFVLASAAFLKTLIEYLTTEYALTNQRVVTKRGWIARYTTETLLTRVEGIHLRQSVAGRLLNYATVIISGTGEQKNIFPTAAWPVRFMRSVQSQVEITRSANGN